MPRHSGASVLIAVTIAAVAVGTAFLDAQQRGAPRPVFPGAPPRDVPADSAGAAVMSGRVTRADTGEPIRRARVTARAGRGTQVPQGFTTSTDAEGRFELVDLPAGRYTLSARKAGFVTLQHGQRRVDEPGTAIQVTARQVLDELDFRLPRGGVISGHIRDEFSEPISEARVSVLTQRYSQGRRELVPAGQGGRTDDRGQFRMYGLPPGQYWVSASLQDVQSGMATSSDTQGYATTFYPGTVNVAEAQMLSLDVGQELTWIDYVLVPVPTARVSGTAIDARGRPFANAVVVVMQRLGGLFMGAAGALTDADGGFVLSNLSPGTYTLRVQGMGFNPDRGVASSTVTVSGADVSGVLLAASTGVTARGVVVTEGTEQPTFAPSRVRVMPQPVDPSGFAVMGLGMGGPSSVEDDWTFEVRGLPRQRADPRDGTAGRVGSGGRSVRRARHHRPATDDGRAGRTRRAGSGSHESDHATLRHCDRRERCRRARVHGRGVRRRSGPLELSLSIRDNRPPGSGGSVQDRGSSARALLRRRGGLCASTGVDLA